MHALFFLPLGYGWAEPNYVSPVKEGLDVRYASLRFEAVADAFIGLDGTNCHGVKTTKAENVRQLGILSLVAESNLWLTAIKKLHGGACL